MSENSIPKSAIMLMPRAPGSDTPEMRMNLTLVFKALGRIEEVAMLSSQKAPELMSAFNKAYLVLGKFAAVVGLEKSKAKGALDEIRARIILEKAPIVLEQHRVRESDATRQAVCDLDPEYKHTRDTFDRLVALHEVMKHQMKSLEMAYTSAKKVLGEHNPNLIDQRSLYDGVADENKHAGDQEDSIFGVPR